ncbi:DJ-1/PfpI family protein [Henriciella barbarensis]|uniref:DJ-1/PfpI family protein n=1 Tax=Henriciella barbarensis TaxID=86342 RepID=A0A399QQ90_9PROT|nr:DJ-1/PfpI family protein [Henriciella barbarensis]RIJ20345.1 DJ-1/PfpI family protein [Henriciella barbarensis]
MPELSPISVAFLVFPNVTQLDLTGPAQVLSRLGNTTVDLLWKTKAPVPTDAGFSLLPTKTFADIESADILCVPGGFGTMDVIQDEEALGWVRKAGAEASWVTSVCTGSIVLGAAGLLKGYRATTHWASHEQLEFFGAAPVKQRVVSDRNRVTGGGVTAGIGFGLALAAKIRGEDHAKFIQLSIEYDPQPPFDSGSPAKADAVAPERYWGLMNKSAPGRAAKVKAIAKGLGF